MRADPFIRRGILAAFALLVLVPSIGGADTLFALVDTGELFASADGGTTWTARAALPVADAAGLIGGAASSELFLASESGAIFRSTDSGSTWIAVGAIAAPDVVDLAGLPTGRLLVLTRAGSLWLSTDEGRSFTALGALTLSNAVSLVSWPAAGKLYAVTETGEVARSADGGATWTAVGAIAVSDAVSIRRIEAALYVLSGSGVVYRSMDDGATWVAVGTLSQVGMSSFSPYGDELAAVTREGEVARSENGASWTWVGTVNQLVVRALANDTPQAIGIPESNVPLRKLALAPPAPNPLRTGSALRIRFTLPEYDTIEIVLFDGMGRRVASRNPQSFGSAGEYELTWDPGSLASGSYFIALRTAHGFEAGRGVTVLR